MLLRVSSPLTLLIHVSLCDLNLAPLNLSSPFSNNATPSLFSVVIAKNLNASRANGALVTDKSKNVFPSSNEK
jgi:hypothetical protein